MILDPKIVLLGDRQIAAGYVQAGRAFVSDCLGYMRRNRLLQYSMRRRLRDGSWMEVVATPLSTVLVVFGGSKSGISGYNSLRSGTPILVLIDSPTVDKWGLSDPIAFFSYTGSDWKYTDPLSAGSAIGYPYSGNGVAYPNTVYAGSRMLFGFGAENADRYGGVSYGIPYFLDLGHISLGWHLMPLPTTGLNPNQPVYLGRNSQGLEVLVYGTNQGYFRYEYVTDNPAQGNWKRGALAGQLGSGTYYLTKYEVGFLDPSNPSAGVDIVDAELASCTGASLANMYVSRDWDVASGGRGYTPYAVQLDPAFVYPAGSGKPGLYGYIFFNPNDKVFYSTTQAPLNTYMLNNLMFGAVPVAVGIEPGAAYRSMIVIAQTSCAGVNYLKSNDGGQSWFPVSGIPDMDVSVVPVSYGPSLSIDGTEASTPLNNVCFIGGTENIVVCVRYAKDSSGAWANSIYRSTDNGASWSFAANLPPNTQPASDSAMTPFCFDGSCIVLPVFQYNPAVNKTYSYLMYSLDLGHTWVLGDAGFMDICYSPPLGFVGTIGTGDTFAVFAFKIDARGIFSNLLYTGESGEMWGLSLGNVTSCLPGANPAIPELYSE